VLTVTRPIGSGRVQELTELGQAGWALDLARRALGRHRGRAGVEQFQDSPLKRLVAAAPHAGLETVHAILRAVLQLPPR
jgi:hypothetical protein